MLEIQDINAYWLFTKLTPNFILRRHFKSKYGVEKFPL